MLTYLCKSSLFISLLLLAPLSLLLVLLLLSIISFFYEHYYHYCYYYHNRKNYNFLDYNWIRKLLFSTNSLVKLWSDCLLSDSSISQSYSKFLFKSTNHFQSCSLNQPITTLGSIIIQFSLSFVTCPFFFSRKCVIF